jgi:hypothetical protein
MAAFLGCLRITSHLARCHQLHTPSDRLELGVSMVEAMDDSLLISSDLLVLKGMAGNAGRFQATYG